MSVDASSQLYPPAPTGVPAELSVPNASYKRMAVAAVVGVVLFFAAYFGLVAWLAYVFFRAIRTNDGDFVRVLMVTVPCGVLLVVLVKGLFTQRKRGTEDLVEITESEQPELFAFIHRVAADVGAQRPAHIYLSADVNAAVFLDTGLLNLLIPTRKNLIVGLGLVNGLSLDEMKAVIAHEFGHFAQRSMGIGQWVYIAQGFVADLVARRDAIDRFLHGLSRWDFRIAWIGWVLRALIWAIRAVVEQLFRFVVLLGRALSREMEFQADLVSVRVSGSDSLVHALHRLGAADRGFGEAASFAVRQAQRGRRVADLFAVQDRFVARYREVHALPAHGATPSRPEGSNGEHRVFAHAVADAPRMWSTHPSNNDREENCKRAYFPSSLDPRPAWAIFRDPERLRREMTTHFLERVLAADQGKGSSAPTPPLPAEAEPIEETLARVDEGFDRPALDRRYHGLYTTQQFTRGFGAGEPMATRPPDGLSDAALAASFRDLFDEKLGVEVEAFFQLEEELARLEGLKKGFLEAPGGVIVHRGRQLRRRELSSVVHDVRGEFEAKRRLLVERFSSALGHAVILAKRVDARRAGLPAGGEPTWAQHVMGLAALLHYGEHGAADLGDVVDHIHHVLRIVFADGSVSSRELDRLVKEGTQVADRLRFLFEQRQDVVLPDPVRQRLTKDGLTWAAITGNELNLQPPTREDFANEWLSIAESWWEPYLAHLGALATVTLDVLIETEELLLRHVEAGTDPGPAPAPARVPQAYTVCCHGEELPRQERLGLWDRFQTAEGWSGSVMRTAAAAAILAPAVYAGTAATVVTLDAYNGLAVPVMVSVDGDERLVLPGAHASYSLSGDTAAVTSTTADGEVIEELTADIGGYGHPIYNVAGAGLLVRRWALYGPGQEPPPEQVMDRVFDADADFVFEPPPDSISTRRGRSATRSVLEAAGPNEVLALLGPGDAVEAAAVHVQYDPPASAAFAVWVTQLPSADQVPALQAAYRRSPSLPVLFQLGKRLSRGERSAFCARSLALTDPEGPDLAEAAWCDLTGGRVPALLAAQPGAWPELLGIRTDAARGAYLPALDRLRALDGLLDHPAAGIRFYQAILLRILGRPDDALSLPPDGAIYDFVAGVERLDEGLAPFAAPTFARFRGDWSNAALEPLLARPSANDLALGAASAGAPARWRDALAASDLPITSVPAAVSAWAVGALVGDEALRARAVAAEADVGGTVFLDRLDPDEIRERPGVLVDADPDRTLMGQAGARLLGVLLLGEDAPPDWRHMAEAVFFRLERPVLP